MANNKLRAAILIISETASREPSTDKCIPILEEVFETLSKDQWAISVKEIVPDNVLDIQRFIQRWTDKEDFANLIITSGGTGFAVKDHTPEAIIPS
jgi:gephyrin